MTVFLWPWERGAIGFQSTRSMRIQENGRILARNTPALYNLAEVNVMFWDGRISVDPLTSVFKTPIPFRKDVRATLKSALAAQAIFPIITHDEMLGAPGSNPIASAASTDEAWDLIVEKVINSKNFKNNFETVFPGEKNKYRTSR
jgi:cytochrome c peroxidase